jgi:hypothetical protein
VVIPHKISADGYVCRKKPNQRQHKAIKVKKALPVELAHKLLAGAIRF